MAGRRRETWLQPATIWLNTGSSWPHDSYNVLEGELLRFTYLADDVKRDRAKLLLHINGYWITDLQLGVVVGDLIPRIRCQGAGESFRLKGGCRASEASAVRRGEGIRGISGVTYMEAMNSELHWLNMEIMRLSHRLWNPGTIT